GGGFTERVEGEVEVRERRRRIGVGPELRDELVARQGALTVQEQQREQLLGLCGTPSAVAEAHAARPQLKRPEHEHLDALGERRRDGLRDGRGRGGQRLQQHRQESRFFRRELEVRQQLAERVGQRRTQEQEVPVPLGGDRPQRGLERGRIVLEARGKQSSLCLQIA